MLRKLVIIGGVGILAIGLMVFLLGFFNSSKDLKSDSIDVSIIPTINQKKPENTQSFYELEIPVPENWKFEKTSFPGGESIAIRPKINLDGDYFPSIVIITYPKDEYKNLLYKLYSLKKLGMQSYTTTIKNGTVLTGIQGLNPLMTIIDGKKKNYYDTILLYSSDSYVYYVEYKYLGENKNKEYEEIFNTILSSIRFN